jgi:hypothetical protein
LLPFLRNACSLMCICRMFASISEKCLLAYVYRSEGHSHMSFREFLPTHIRSRKECWLGSKHATCHLRRCLICLRHFTRAKCSKNYTTSLSISFVSASTHTYIKFCAQDICGYHRLCCWL